jgi:hypothetical protein
MLKRNGFILKQKNNLDENWFEYLDIDENGFKLRNDKSRKFRLKIKLADSEVTDNPASVIYFNKRLILFKVIKFFENKAFFYTKI